MNQVCVNSLLLVGLREWEGPDNFKIADLLHVYSDDDVARMQSLPALCLPAPRGAGPDRGAVGAEYFQFTAEDKNRRVLYINGFLTISAVKTTVFSGINV